MKTLIKVTDLKNYTFKEGKSEADFIDMGEGDLHVNPEILSEWEKHEVPATPKPEVEEPKFEELVLKPTGKKITKYTRYEMSEDGSITNSSTGAVVKSEDKGGKLKARLTSDSGSRDWVDIELIKSELFKPEPVKEPKPPKVVKGPKEAKEPKVKKEVVPGEAKISKSQSIYIMAKLDGKTAAQICGENPDFNPGHVRNVIKDYEANPDKAAKAVAAHEAVNAAKK